MAKVFALVVGTFFFLVGMMGLLQEPVVSDGLLRDVLAVNPAHDALRLAVGALGILAYVTGWSRTYCGALGVSLVLIGLLGFVPGVAAGGMLLGIVEVTWANNVLHLVVGTAALVIGLGLSYDRQTSPTH